MNNLVSDLVADSRKVCIQANMLLAGPSNNFDMVVSNLEFMELFEDVAINAQYALGDSVKNSEFINAVTCGDTIVQANGGRTRSHFSEDANWWQRLRIEGTKDGGLKYTTLTVQAHADMRIQAVQRRSSEPFLKELTTPDICRQ